VTFGDMEVWIPKDMAAEVAAADAGAVEADGDLG
jgi:hypothetical protein